MKKTILLIIAIFFLIVGVFVFVQNAKGNASLMEVQKIDNLDSTDSTKSEIIDIKTDDNVDYLGGRDIAPQMPEGEFSLSEGSVLSGKIEVYYEVNGAKSVEFYTRRIEALTKIYLGQGRKVSDNAWVYSWDTSSVPNGDYYLFTQVTNEYGQYHGGKVHFSVENEVEENTEAIQDLEEQIQEEEDAISNQEQEITASHEELIQSITAQIDDWTQDTDEILGSNHEDLKDQI